MTVDTALGKLDKLTVNQLKHFIHLCDEELGYRQFRPFGYLGFALKRNRQLKTLKAQFEKELATRKYWKKV